MFKLLNLILLLINLATNTLYLLWLCNIFCCSNENKFLMKFLWHTSNFYSLMSKSCYISIDLIHLKFWINSINSIVPTVTFFYFKLCLCHVSQYVSYIDQTVFRYVSYRLYLIDTQPYSLEAIFREINLSLPVNAGWNTCCAMGSHARRRIDTGVAE